MPRHIDCSLHPHPAATDASGASIPSACPVCKHPAVRFERRVGRFSFFRCSGCSFLWALAQVIVPLVEVAH